MGSSRFRSRSVAGFVLAGRLRDTYALGPCPRKGFVESSSDYDWHRHSSRDSFLRRSNLAVGQADDKRRNRRVLRNPLWHSNLCDRLHLVDRQNNSCGVPPSLMRTRYPASRSTKR